MKLSVRWMSEALVLCVLELRQYNRCVNLLKHSINHALCLEYFYGVQSLCTRADNVLYMF